MANRKNSSKNDGSYQHKVLGRTMCEWTTDGKVRIPTKRLDPADVHMVVGGIVHVLAKFAPETLLLLQHAFAAHIDMARRGIAAQKELPMETAKE